MNALFGLLIVLCKVILIDFNWEHYSHLIYIMIKCRAKPEPIPTLEDPFYLVTCAGFAWYVPRTTKSQTFELGRTIWADKFWGIWGIFGQFIIVYFGTVSPCFLLINHYFCEKLSLYIKIPNIYLGLGFEFGPQRIWDLAIVCP